MTDRRSHRLGRTNDWTMGRSNMFRALKRLGVLYVISLIAACAATAPRAPVSEIAFETAPTRLEVNGVGAIDGVEYTLGVPENRNDPGSKTIDLRFVVLPALAPSGAAPVVYLAGGPGGSATGTARGPRWPLFDALRQTRDVVLLDQRGTGRSQTPPICESGVGWGPGDVGDRATFISKHREAFAACQTFWAEAGVDIRGYTTAESAADIADVSRALGTPVALLGISYGTHLALATLSAHPGRVTRAVLVSVEGLDQTVKLPERTDAYFARLQKALDHGLWSEARPGGRDLAEALRSALDRIDRERPVIDMYFGGNAPPAQRTLGAFAVQRAISYSVSDPDRAGQVASAIFAMAADTPDDRFMAYFGFLMPEVIELQAMPTMMDLASGISTERAAQVAQQAQGALLADAPNFPMPHLDDLDAPYRLPDPFRQGPMGDTPVLVFSGTLDGRTYPEAALEATQGLSQRTVIKVENGGHNLFFDHPDIVPTLIAFLDGQTVSGATLTADLPKDPAP
ncbi:MAG: alpha/beta fold hydrolase [Pseudomonadota bacterium]